MGAFVGELEADLARGDEGPREPRPHGCARRTTSTSAPPTTCSPTSTRSARSTGALPTDRRIVVERFRDELGDWRLCLLTPFGGRVHAPWSLAIEARIGERLGLEVQTIWSDDGIAIRLPEGDAPLDGIEALLFPEPDEVEDLVVGRWRPRRCSPAGSARTRPGRCSCRAAGPGPGRRSGSSASARRTCWPSRRATAASRSWSRPTASACPTCSTCRRCARSWAASRGARSRSTASRRRKASPFASEPDVRLRRRLHVRGRRAARRAAGRRADARPRPAPRAARPGGAARAARSGCAGRSRAEPPGARPTTGARRPPTASTTCSAGSATCRRPRWPPGPRAALAAAGAVARRAGGGPPGRPDPDRRRRPLDRDRGRGALSRRRRDLAAGRRPGGVPRARPPARSMGCSRAGRGRTARS